MLDYKREIAANLSALDYLNDPEATDKAEEWKAMDISCDAVIVFAERHANLAEEHAKKEPDPIRKAELLKIAEVCRRVPAHAPRNLWEAIQMYWFVHLGTITDRVLKAVLNNFQGEEVLRQTIMNRTPFFGNDDDTADSIAVKVYNDLFEAIDGKPNIKREGSIT